MNTKEILEPKKEFNRYYEEVDKSATSIFGILKKKSNIDENLNRELVLKIKEKDEQIKKQENLIKTASIKFGLLIFLLILLIVGIIILLNTNIVKTILVISLIACIVAIGFIIYFIVISKNTLNNYKAINNKLISERNKLKSDALKSISDLLSKFDETTIMEVIKTACPIISLDKEFDVKKYSYMKKKYGLIDITENNRSIYHCLSGSINSNPFFYQKIYEQSMINKTYSGSLTIFWTETEYDSEGHPHQVSRSETLYATYEHPEPFYSMETSLIYANDAAPNLSFSRYPTGMDLKSEKEIESFVKRRTKKLERKENRDINNENSDFQIMGNEEFDCIFNATNRTNEREFRLLFTPLAQKNLLSLLKDKSPYGDDFNFKKRNCINIIKSKHMQSNDLLMHPSSYLTYDIDSLELSFKDYTKKVFTSIYFDLAPLLSIPLYQMYKPREMIYDEEYLEEFNFTTYEDESIANKFDLKYFAPLEASTPSIIKVKGVKKDESSDIVLFRAYAFETINRTIVVSMMGGDGLIHGVPVNYIDYIPVKKDTFVTFIHSNMTKESFINSNKNNELSNLIKEYGSKNYIYQKGILAIITNKTYNSSVLQKINKFINREVK